MTACSSADIGSSVSDSASISPFGFGDPGVVGADPSSDTSFELSAGVLGDAGVLGAGVFGGLLCYTAGRGLIIS